MLSILIPTYNYNAFPLAQELEKQALALGVPFELICIDDGSFSSLNEENQKINSLTNCRFIENRKNLGDFGTRKLLAEKALYDWLLFLDSDVFPSKKDFLELYIKCQFHKLDVVFGGIAYKDDSIYKSKTLRWRYGRDREQKTVKEREANPYASFLAGCFMIKKSTFLNLIKGINLKGYGLDILFSYQLKTNEACIIHIDNPVFHLGLDTNKAYLKKSKKAVDLLYFLYEKKHIPYNYTPLLHYYTRLKKIKATALFKNLISFVKKPIENNLLSEKPSLFLFDLYRLGYLCSLKSSK